MAGIEDRLNALEQRYQEIEADLAAPDAYNDLDRVQKLSQEQARLRDVVETGRTWRSATSAGREAQEMARSDSDPEVVAMALEEERVQRVREEEAFESLRRLLLPQDPNDTRDVIV